MAARHSVRVNAFDGIALTRLDILTGFDELQLCVAYDVDGERLDHFPTLAETLERCRPVYENLPGWSEGLTSARGWGDLPASAQAYVRRIEVMLETPVQLIGVGQGREEIVQL